MTIRRRLLNGQTTDAPPADGWLARVPAGPKAATPKPDPVETVDVVIRRRAAGLEGIRRRDLRLAHQAATEDRLHSDVPVHEVDGRQRKRRRLEVAGRAKRQRKGNRAYARQQAYQARQQAIIAHLVEMAEGRVPGATDSQVERARLALQRRVQEAS